MEFVQSQDLSSLKTDRCARNGSGALRGFEWGLGLVLFFVTLPAEASGVFLAANAAEPTPAIRVPSVNLQIPALLRKEDKAPVAAKKTKSDKPQFRPAWASRKSGIPSANVSYLMSTSNQTDGFYDTLFDARNSHAARMEWEHTMDAQEARDNAGLTEYHEERSRFDQMKAMAKSALQSIYKRRLKMVEGKRLKTIAEDAPAAVRDPVAAAVVAASIYNGKNVNFRMMDGLTFSGRTALKHKEAAFSMSFYDTGLSSTVQYNRTDNLTAQLAQQLSPEISAVLNSAQRGSAQLVYSLSF